MINGIFKRILYRKLLCLSFNEFDFMLLFFKSMIEGEIKKLIHSLLGLIKYTLKCSKVIYKITYFINDESESKFIQCYIFRQWEGKTIYRSGKGTFENVPHCKVCPP